MKIALLTVGTILTFLSLFSAIGKFRKMENVIAAMHHVGVKDAQIPLLATLEAFGGLGLIVGIWSRPLGIAAASGLVLYFLAAVAAHLRKQDKVKDFAPALFIFLLSAVVLLLELKRK